MPANDAIKANILVVDDEREHAQVMCEALIRQGHKCDVTYSLPEAKARLDKKNYDVVVTDLVMGASATGWRCCTFAGPSIPPRRWYW